MLNINTRLPQAKKRCHKDSYVYTSHIQSSIQNKGTHQQFIIILLVILHHFNPTLKNISQKFILKIKVIFIKFRCKISVKLEPIYSFTFISFPSPNSRHIYNNNNKKLSLLVFNVVFFFCQLYICD